MNCAGKKGDEMKKCIAANQAARKKELEKGNAKSALERLKAAKAARMKERKLSKPSTNNAPAPANVGGTGLKTLANKTKIKRSRRKRKTNNTKPTKTRYA